MPTASGKPSSTPAQHSLVCAVFLLSHSDLSVLLVASGILVIGEGVLHRESHREKLFPVIDLIRVLNFLKLKGKGFLPIFPLQGLCRREEHLDFHIQEPLQ